VRRPSPDLLVTVGVALVILGPLLLGGGLWLVGDMVFVPHQPWKSAWLGLDGSLPRAVPMDGLISVVTQVVPGSVVQRVLLVGGLVAGGLGVARLVTRLRPELPWYARAAAITLYCWNPWAYERLLIGQWAILLGYLLLPWVALAALRLRAERRDWGPAAVVLVASSVCSPSSGVMAVGVVAVLALGRDAVRWLQVGVLALGANLTWLVPALTADAVHVSVDGVFAGFAARAESAAGTAASVLSLGGIWKTSIVPAERTSALLVLLSCLLSVVALAGLRRVPDRGRWLLLGAISVGLALLPAVAGGAELLQGVGDRVPGLALLRDSHRFLAPFGLVLAVGAASAVAELRARVRPGAQSLWSAVALVVVAPLLLLPSLAWGGLGELQRSSYPQAWDDVADRIGAHDTTVVLPWSGLYRGFDWNHRRAVLDPAPRYLPGTVLIDDRVLLRDVIVPPEDPRVVAVGSALAAPDPSARLRALGVRWVLVENGMTDVVVPAGAVSYDGGGLTLVDLAANGPVAPSRQQAGPMRQLLVSIGHSSAILLLLAGAAWILRSGSNEHHNHESHGE
jgi:hypothetical protein